MGEAGTHEREIVFAVELTNSADAVQPLLIPRSTGQGVARVGGIGDQAALTQLVHHLLDQTCLWVDRVQLDIT